MYCTRCGKQIPDDFRLCPLCAFDLSYESTALADDPDPERKTEKRSRAGGILIGCAAALLIAEGAYLIGYAPVHGAKSAAVASAPAEKSSQGIVDLIPTAAPVRAAKEKPDTRATAAEEPTPTPTVTPIGQLPPSKVTATLRKDDPSIGAEDAANPGTGGGETLSSEDGAYVLPDDEALSRMSAEELRIARNEIYARHGLIFKAGDLNDYFSSKDWYEGTVTDADSIALSEEEFDTIDRILAYEDALAEG